MEQVPADEVLVELAVGLLPVVGEGADLMGAVVGLSVLGRQLTPEERLLCAVGVVLPLISGALLANAAEVERAALLTGRSLQEAQVLQRVVQHLAPAETERVQRLLRAWVDYQFRHPGKYPRFRYAPDGKWQRMYRTALENLEQGGEFEQKVLKANGYEKNTALLLPPPGSSAQGFIPDSVMGNPEELVWGRPYRFIEVKAREDMALTGNLKSMLEYVRDHGGHIEIWFRSAHHSNGQTRLSKQLRQRIAELARYGRVQVKWFP